MANLGQVQNILEKAKYGQRVVPFCNCMSSDFEGYVVQLDKNNAIAIRIEDWFEGWPDTPTPTGDDLLAIKYTDGIALYTQQEDDEDWSFTDDGTLVKPSGIQKEIDHTL